jgi:hypothetical protein
MADSDSKSHLEKINENSPLEVETSPAMSTPAVESQDTGPLNGHSPKETDGPVTQKTARKPMSAAEDEMAAHVGRHARLGQVGPSLHLFFSDIYALLTVNPYVNMYICTIFILLLVIIHFCQCNILMLDTTVQCSRRNLKGACSNFGHKNRSLDQ